MRGLSISLDGDFARDNTNVGTADKLLTGSGVWARRGAETVASLARSSTGAAVPGRSNRDDGRRRPFSIWSAPAVPDVDAKPLNMAIRGDSVNDGVLARGRNMETPGTPLLGGRMPVLFQSLAAADSRPVVSNADMREGGRSGKSMTRDSSNTRMSTGPYMDADAVDPRCRGWSSTGICVRITVRR